MSGNLAIPNVFATQLGAVPAAQLDANWNTVRDYINPREITSGTLAARPVTPDPGTWYFATDSNGGTLYFSAGTGWFQAAVAITSGVIVPVPISQGGTGSTTWQAAGFLMVNGTQPFKVEGTPLNVPFGGTGSTTWQANTVLLGNTTSPFGVVSLTPAGTLLVGQTGANPIPLAVGANSTVLIADSTVGAGVRWGVRAKYQISGGDGGATLGAGTTNFCGNWASSTTETNVRVHHIATSAGTLRNLFVQSEAVPGAGQTFIWTVRINAVNTAITATISGAGQSAANDTTNTATVNPGDNVTVQVVISAGAAVTSHQFALEIS